MRHGLARRRPRSAWCRCAAAPIRRPTSPRPSPASRRRRGRGAQIVCLQELFRSQYFCQREDAALFDLAEPIPGPSTEALGRGRRGAPASSVVASLFEKRAEGVFHNTAVLIDADGSLAGLYRKMHIPDDPLYYEKYYFTPGDLGFRSFDTPAGRIGALVCWDQWFPEAARLTALRGAEILFYPDGDRLASEREGGVRRGAARARGRRSSAPTPSPTASSSPPSTASASKANLEFWGGSFVCDPFGRVLARASHDREEVLVVECDRRLIGRDAAQLAVPARPPHRRVRRAAEALPRLSARRARASRAGRSAWRHRVTELLTPTPGSPAALGYRMPAEWEPHAATWLSWPHKESSWPGKLARIPPIWVEMVRALVAGRGRPHPGQRRGAGGAGARSCSARAGVPLARVHLHEVPTDDAWMRDHGPTFITRGGRRRRELALVDWKYNAWGGKYPPWEQDDQVPARDRARCSGCRRSRPGSCSKAARSTSTDAARC